MKEQKEPNIVPLGCVKKFWNFTRNWAVRLLSKVKTKEYNRTAKIYFHKFVKNYRVSEYKRRIQGLLVTGLVNLNHGQVAKTTPELLTLPTSTPMGGRLKLDRFNKRRTPTRQVFSVPLLELMTLDL
ncbi:hypothetical protein TNCV_2704421 [Trichonephila clavipes]|nr:hypothetical protein TNCV_2704421 [Trichonephila clavipes]